MVTRPTLFVIDFETTGLDCARDYPVQLGYVFLWADGTRTGTKVLIRPPLRAMLSRSFWKAKRVHKLTLREMYLESVPPSEVAASLNILHRGQPDAVIAGHNVGFDYGFLQRLYKLAGEGRPPWDYHLVDLATLGRLLTGERKLHKIGAALDVPPNPNPHDAYADAAFTAECLHAAISRLK